MRGVQKMQNPTEPSPADVFNTIRSHLAGLRNKKRKIIEKYFNEPSPECMEFEELLNSYISEMEQIMRSETLRPDNSGNLPFVIIGSSVEVEDVESGDMFRFKVVPPYQGNSKGLEMCDVSCLSPVGKSLLLKSVGQKVKVAAPGGVFCYKIKSITLP
jgi:transcription elongation factor GreA